MLNFVHSEIGVLSGYPPSRAGVSIEVTCIGRRLAGGESRSEHLQRESRGLEKSHLLWGTGSPDTVVSDGVTCE